MNEFSICSLYSGSTGNATYIRAGETELLVDAGVSATAICRALREIGSDISRISAILVTHEHIDHVKGLEILAKKYRIPVHMTSASAAAMTILPHLAQVLLLHDPDAVFSLGEVQVCSFPVPHDSVCCVGYRLNFAGQSIAIATDIGRVTRPILEQFLGTSAVVIESNHDVDLLLQNPHYPPSLKERILSGNGHLSNDFCARFLAYLAENGTQYALLAHLSRENNTPEIASNVLSAHLSAIPAGASFTYRVAAPTAPTRLL